MTRLADRNDRKWLENGQRLALNEGQKKGTVVTVCGLCCEVQATGEPMYLVEEDGPPRIRYPALQSSLTAVR